MPKFKVNLLAKDGDNLNEGWEEFLACIQKLEQAGIDDINITVSKRISGQVDPEDVYIVAKGSEGERIDAIKDLSSRQGAFEVIVKPIRDNSVRTKQQNKALHLWFKMIKDECDRAGVTKKMFFQIFKDVELPVESEDVKVLCRVVTGALFGKNTTKAIPANKLDDVCELMAMSLAKRLGVAAPKLPSLERLRKESMLKESGPCTWRKQ